MDTDVEVVLQRAMNRIQHSIVIELDRMSCIAYPVWSQPMSVERVLVIDDDPHILQALQYAFEKGGFEALVASDGEMGMEVIRDERPGMIITDILLPNVDGFEIVQWVRADPLLSNTPMMIISAKTAEEDRIRGLELGADDYITKPFSPAEIVAKAKALFRRSNGYRKRKAIPAVRGPFDTEGLERLRNLRFDNFEVGVGNRSGYEAAKAASESPGVRFNPLFIYGSNGLGKTHLVCALANDVYEHDDSSRILYVTSEVFSQQIVDAYRERQVNRFRNEYLQADVFIVDDFQFLSVSPSLQSVAADILAEMHEHGKQIAICSDRRPEELNEIVAEISARLSLGLVVEIDRPDAKLRSRILRSKSRYFKWPLDESILEYLANNIDSDVRTLEGLARRLVAMKTFAGIEPTGDVIDKLIGEISTGPDSFAIQEPVPIAVEPDESESSGSGTKEKSPSLTTSFSQEFSEEHGITSVTDEPEEVANTVPDSSAQPVVILGPSAPIVTDVIESLLDRSERILEIPQGKRWAHLIYKKSDSPRWIIAGTNRWTQGDALALALERCGSPFFLIVFDSGQPDILEARKLLLSVPSTRGLAVSVLVSSISSSTSDATKMTIARSMRRLYRVPDEIPLGVCGAISAEDSQKGFTMASSKYAR